MSTYVITEDTEIYFQSFEVENKLHAALILNCLDSKDSAKIRDSCDSLTNALQELGFTVDMKSLSPNAGDVNLSSSSSTSGTMGEHILSAASEFQDLYSKRDIGYFVFVFIVYNNSDVNRVHESLERKWGQSTETPKIIFYLTCPPPKQDLASGTDASGVEEKLLLSRANLLRVDYPAPDVTDIAKVLESIKSEVFSRKGEHIFTLLTALNGKYEGFTFSSSFTKVLKL
ncbi:hypothetical protein Ahia01_000833600 [Argonauta hians]